MHHRQGKQPNMTNSTTYIFGVALLASLAIANCCAAKDVAQQPAVAPISATSSSQSLASKLMPAQTRSRTSRSLSDMFEKVKSKIFGSKKQALAAATSSQIAPAASVNAVQRQPWGELSTQQLNSLNQQYSPYSALNGYQWPSASGNQMFNQQYSPMGAYPPMSGVQSANSLMSSGIDASQSGSLNPAANSNGQSSNGGLLSSASQLIAQYLTPNSASSSANQAAAANQAVSNSNPQQGSAIQSQNNLMSPQQQQQQTSYNEFASILDSMVAQTGVGSQRQPSLSSYLGQAQPGQQSGQQQVGIQSGQQQPQQPSFGQMGSPAMVGDNEMSGSSSIQSYMPASSQQASQKSSMVSLAEQLAPGAQFNKLVSFPFSLSNNEDPSKEGRYKLHIPFLNQHVKRSDQPAQQVAVVATHQQQQQQQRPQYLNSYYNQPQSQYSNQAQQQPLVAQASQVIPTVVSPQSSASSVQSSQETSSAVASASSSVAQSSQSNIQSAVPSQTSSVSHSSASNSPSVVSSVSSQLQSNGRPSWSIADSQANSASSSKLVPMQSASASSSSDSTASQN